MYYIHRFTIYPWYENTMGGGDKKKVKKHHTILIVQFCLY